MRRARRLVNFEKGDGKLVRVMVNWPADSSRTSRIMNVYISPCIHWANYDQLNIRMSENCTSQNKTLTAFVTRQEERRRRNAEEGERENRYDKTQVLLLRPSSCIWRIIRLGYCQKTMLGWVDYFDYWLTVVLILKSGEPALIVVVVYIDNCVSV